MENETNRMMSEYELSAYLNISVGTIRRWRMFQTGPVYRKLGVLVRYLKQDVDEWLEKQPRGGGEK
jgi:excisionase family DNA binding protein